MDRRKSLGMVLRAPLVLLIAASAAQAQQSWQRAVDWMPGTVQGSTANNPSPVNGQPVWQYESVHGGALGSSNPWYASHDGNLLTWDPAWYQTGWGVWSHGNDVNPPILAGRMIHNVHASVYNDIPLVRWMNPVGDGAQVNLTGTLTLNWNGVDGLGRPVDVDVVIAKYDASLGTTSILFSRTVAKPHPIPSVGDSVLMPISISGVSLDSGDSLIFTERGRSALSPQGAWVNLYDNVVIRQVPAPGTAGLLAMAGIVAGRRRRR